MAEARGAVEGRGVWGRLRSMRWPSSKRLFVVSIASGLLHSGLYLLSTPFGGSWWGFSLLAMLPIMGVAAWGSFEAAKRGAALRWLFVGVMLGCVVREAIQHAWMLPITALGGPPLMVVQALWTGLCTWLMARVWYMLGQEPTPARAAWVSACVAVVWVGVEFFRTRVFMGGYAWGMVVHPLVDWPGAAAWASIGGVWMVSFWVALANAGVVFGLVVGVGMVAPARTRIVGAVLSIFGMGALALGGTLAGWRVPLDGRGVPVAIVQTNVPQSNKVDWTIVQQWRDFVRMIELTDVAARASAQTGHEPPVVVVWPETMMPGMSLSPDVTRTLDDKRISIGGQEPLEGLGGETRIPASEFANLLLASSKRWSVPLLVGDEAITNFRANVAQDGAVSFEFDERFNSVFLVSGGDVASTRYDKMELTSFGETIPFFWRWPGFVEKVAGFAASGMTLDLARGGGPVVFEVPVQVGGGGNGGLLRMATPICFEVTVPEQCVKLVYDKAGRRADVMMNLTNDGWFTSSMAARVQHLQLARWRSIETGTPMVRSANTGISAIIDARGRVTRRGVEQVGVVDAGAMRPVAFVDGVIRDVVMVGGEGREAGPMYAWMMVAVGDVFGWAFFVGTIVASIGAGIGRRPGPRR